MKLTNTRLKQLIREELDAADKAEIKKIAAKEAENAIKDADLKSMIEKEVKKELSSAATKEQIGDVSKKVLKRLYKDLSLQHPYIIDRIKV
tara:strand:- start:636 stop:908 length:273 start_codon:yes stop_codon:yes gene_type:complete